MNAIDCRAQQCELWTVEDVRARIVEAMDTLRRLKFPHNGAPPIDLRSSHPEPLDEWSAYGWTDEETRPAPPSPQAISRLDETLPWLLWIEWPRQRSAVCLRARGWPWRRIGRAIGYSHEGARQIEAEGIFQILERLNDGNFPVDKIAVS